MSTLFIDCRVPVMIVSGTKGQNNVDPDAMGLMRDFMWASLVILQLCIFSWKTVEKCTIFRIKT